MTMDEKAKAYAAQSVRSAVLKRIKENDDLAVLYRESHEYRSAVSDVIGWIADNAQDIQFNRPATGDIKLRFELILDMSKGFLSADETHERIPPDVV